MLGVFELDGDTPWRWPKCRANQIGKTIDSAFERDVRMWREKYSRSLGHGLTFLLALTNDHHWSITIVP